MDTEMLLENLKIRFEKNIIRHPKIKWLDVQTKLKLHQEKLNSLYKMEQTSGEPDVIYFDEKNNEYIFVDCSVESPKDRRNLCYDQEARTTRKTHAPTSSATEMAKELGIELLTQDLYTNLQKLGNFDTKTSSWIQTPPNIRKLGGALFADKRYGAVFVYHNSAQSYYGSRGFRGFLRV